MDPQAEKIAGRILSNATAHRKAAQQRAAQRKKNAAAAVAHPTSKHLPIPGLEFLGAGYNVFGRYASAEEVKANIFDFTIDGTVDQQLYDESLAQVRSNVENAFVKIPDEIKLVYARPVGVQYKALFEANLDFSETGSMTDEQSALAAHFDIEGQYGLFAGEFSARYSSTASKLATAKCYSATALMRYYELSMANFALRPLKYIRPVVRQELNNPSISPEDIFAKYGTHYLYTVAIGSKIVYGHTVDSSKTTKSYDAAAELRARYGEPGAQISGGGGIDVKGSSAQAADAESISFNAVGVSDEQLQAAETADTNPLAVLKQGWHNPSLVDFPQDALKPIWDLCDADARRQKLHDAYTAYASKHGSLVGANADLVPLYLFKSPHGDPPAYRFSTNRNESVVDGVAWTPADEDGKAALYIFSEKKDGTVPLFEYHFPVPSMPGLPSASDVLTRYETSRWQSYLATFGAGWKKVSGNPLGWVYDGLAPAPTAPFVAPAGGVQDVYAYYPNNAGGGFLSRYLYSTDSADGRDGGAWRPAAGIDDDLPLPSDAEQRAVAAAARAQMIQRVATDPDAIAVLKLGTNNVHWRAPTL
jgi:hypothetical protein